MHEREVELTKHTFCAHRRMRQKTTEIKKLHFFEEHGLTMSEKAANVKRKTLKD